MFLSHAQASKHRLQCREFIRLMLIPIFCQIYHLALVWLTTATAKQYTINNHEIDDLDCTYISTAKFYQLHLAISLSVYL